MAKRGRRLGQTVNPRDGRGWLVPRAGTVRRKVYDLLVAGKNTGAIHTALGISYASAAMHKRHIIKADRCNALKYNSERPDEEAIEVPGGNTAKADIERLRRALIEIEYHSTDKNAAATARAALASTDR